MVTTKLTPEALHPSWIKGVEYYARHTNDMPDLVGMEHVLMFLPGHRPSVQTLIAPVFTQSTYKVFDTKDYTILLPHSSVGEATPSWGNGNSDAAAVVRGNLTNTTVSELVDLDNLYENGVKFQRTQIRVIIPYKFNRDGGAIYATSRLCYAYIGIASYWEPLLDQGYTTKQRKTQPSGLRVVPNHVAEY
jgi:hypothetical protein